MSNNPTERRKRLLDPIARISKIIFGLIMALAFTGSISVAVAGREEVKLMLFIAGAALGRYAVGQRPWRIGLVMVGSVLVLLTIALGG